MKRIQVVLLLFAIVPMFAITKAIAGNNNQPKTSKFVYHGAGNPYLPLWEHLPDGEPRVFEDPDNPGKFRAYIIGSHDVRFGSYCGPDIRMWSAPVEDLSSWRDEGPIFTYQVEGQWDVMYAPDLVEVKGRTAQKNIICTRIAAVETEKRWLPKEAAPTDPLPPST